MTWPAALLVRVMHSAYTLTKIPPRVLVAELTRASLKKMYITGHCGNPWMTDVLPTTPAYGVFKLAKIRENWGVLRYPCM